jgi:hypothetical protein
MNSECNFALFIPFPHHRATLLLPVAGPISSQLALKYLDPAFTPLTNTLTEKAPSNATRWTYNSTAFTQQR